jgi:hypothetical protein
MTCVSVVAYRILKMRQLKRKTKPFKRLFEFICDCMGYFIPFDRAENLILSDINWDENFNLEFFSM